MSISWILFPLLIIGGFFLMTRMHAGHGGGGGCGGGHGSSDKTPAEPVSQPVPAGEDGKPKPPHDHSGH